MIDSCHQITDAGIISLSDSLRSLTSLNTIKLSLVGISLETKAIVTQELKTLPFLTTLHIG